MITGNTFGITEIQQKYFSSKDKCEELIEGFSSAVQDNDPNATIRKSADGVTGFTALCSVPSTHVEGEVAVEPIGTVLKWQSETLCKVEQFGARFFRHLDFQAPITYNFDADHSQLKTLMRVATKDTAFSEKIGTLSCLAMPRLHGQNLVDLTEETDVETSMHGQARKVTLQSIGELEERKMMIEFGKIAAVDLVLGNDDRFIQFPEKGQVDLPTEGRINRGNVMLDFDQNGLLLSVYPIDNSPSSLLLQQEEQRNALSLGYSLFDSDSSSDNSIENSTQSSREDKSSDQALEIERFHQTFQNFSLAPETSATQFASTYIKKINPAKENFEELQDAFLEGVKFQILCMKEAAGNLKEKVHNQNQNDEQLAPVIELVLKNLSHLEKIELNE